MSNGAPFWLVLAGLAAGMMIYTIVNLEALSILQSILIVAWGGVAFMALFEVLPLGKGNGEDDPEEDGFLDQQKRIRRRNARRRRENKRGF